MTYFDRFDICEAWNVWAHDWGQYATIARLRRMDFKSSHTAEFYDGLTDNGREIYDALNARSEAAPDWYNR